MHRLFVLTLAVGMLGCGGDATSPDASSAVGIRDRTLKRVEVLEKQVASDDVKAKNVQELTVSLKYLVGHMQKEQVGTEEQIQSLATLHRRLMEGGGRPALPARDWRPDSGQAPPAAKIDAGPLKELLPELRKTLEAIQ